MGRAARLDNHRPLLHAARAKANRSPVATAMPNDRRRHLLPLALWPLLAVLGCANAAPTADDGVPVATDAAALADAAVASDSAKPAPGACLTAADCPAVTAVCQTPQCVNSQCGTKTLSSGPCEDGDPCTLGEKCDQGACVASIDLCACRSDKDCPDDGDLCNGTPFCDKSALPYACRGKPASAIVCKASGDTACTKNACVAKTGQCVATAIENATFACADGACGWRESPAPSGAIFGCDDGSPCTLGDICAKGQCQAGADVCACHSDTDCPDDANLCNGKPYCDKSKPPWQCKTNPGSVVACIPTSDTACAKAVCLPATGTCTSAPVEQVQQACDSAGCSWQLAPPGATAPPLSCSDGNPCTQGEACSNGQCAGGTETCKCKTDLDCAAKEDGNLCNGTLFCNKASGDCQVNPATQIGCPSGEDTACAKNVCYPKTGACQPASVEFTEQVCAKGACHWQLLPPGTGNSGVVGCNDGIACTSGEACSGGQCQGGVDTCACKVDSDCQKLDDGDLCNGTLYCNKATQQCQFNPASLVNCQSVGNTDCTWSACDPKTGQCQPTVVGKVVSVCVGPAGAPTACVVEVAATPEKLDIGCEDGDPCTKGDVCVTGTCKSGAQTCSCKTDGDCAAQDDGDLCNGTFFCNKQNGKCAFNPATVVNCPSVGDTTCLKNACQPQTGACLPTAAELTQIVCDAASGCHLEAAPKGKVAPLSACEDGQVCTKGDVCGAGKCASGVFVCECNTAADCASKDDGNLCNGVFYCDKTDLGDPKCKPNPASAVLCPPANGQCVSAQCNPATGLCGQAAAQQGKSCDDGTLCTANDVCSNGSCVGLALDCSDGTACTNDSCAPTKGCAHVLTNCDDGNGCTLDLCDGATGKCLYDATKLNNTPCSDGNGCTVSDVCSGGKCNSGAVASCPLPALACQIGVCVAKDAKDYTCISATAPDGAGCGDGKACTLDATCKSGQCQPGTVERYSTVGDTDSSGNHVRWTAVSPAANGEVAVAGVAWTGGSNGIGSSATKWTVAKISAAGKIVWSQLMPTLMGPVPDQNVLTVLAAADGSTYLAGTDTAPNGSGGSLPQKPFIARYTSDGKQDWKKLYGSADTIQFCTAALLAPGGVSWLAGPKVVGTTTTLFVAQVAPTWEPSWQKDFDVGQNLQVVQVLPQPGGGVVVVGTRGNTPTGQTLLAFIDADGNLLAQKMLPNPAAGNYKVRFATSAGLRGDGAIVVVGNDVGFSIKRPFQALTKPDGELWVADFLGNPGRFLAVAVAGGDQTLLAGQYQPLGAANPTGWLQGTDGWLNGQWSAAATTTQQSYGAATAHIWYGAAASPGGGWLAVGAMLHPTAGWRPLLLRADAWGHGTCSEAGVCAGKPGKACDDADPCTLDTCTAVAGCGSQVVANLRCLPADNCSEVSSCGGGACKQTDFGRLYARPQLKGSTTYALSQLTDGTTVATGTTGPATAPQAWVGRSDPAGNLGWTDVFSMQPSLVTLQYAYGHAVAPTPDGGFLIAANSRENDSNIQGCVTCLKRYRRLRRYTASKGLAWEIWSTASTMQESDDLLAHGDGTWTWLWRDADGVKATKVNQSGVVVYEKGFYGPLYDGTAITKFAFGMHGSPTNDGGAWVSGWRWQANLRHPWAVKLDNAANAVLTNHAILTAQNSNGHVPIRLAASGDGGFYGLFQRLLTSGGVVSVFARFDAGANVLWQQVLQDDAAYSAWDVRLLADGTLWLAGEALLNGDSFQWLDRRTAAGLRAQRALLPMAGPAFAVQPLASLDLLVGGRATLADGIWSTLQRTDPWGHPGCKAAGVCAAVAAAQCDDGQPCTADLCDPVSICSQKPIAGCK